MGSIIGENRMIEYTWMVWQNNRLVGYVTAFSEWEAYATAAKMFGSNFYVERPYYQNQEKTVSA
jgi:CMP-N-acetylneuraminic acid synthetase